MAGRVCEQRQSRAAGNVYRIQMHASCGVGSFLYQRAGGASPAPRTIPPETIQGITIFTSFPSKNTDGIDLTANGAYVEGNSISDGDDVIAIGSSATVVCGKYLRDQLRFWQWSRPFDVSSDTGGGISNLTVINCTFTGTQYGLKGKSARDRGGLAQNVNYLNLTLTNIQFPISYSSYYPQNPTDPSLDTGSPITSTTPFWRNITLSNVTASAATSFSVGSVWGLPEAPVSNLVMKAVSLTGASGLQLFHVRAVSFASDCSINVQSGGRLFTYNAQVSSQLQLTNAFNRAGITSDGAAFTSGGANGSGSAYSATMRLDSQPFARRILFAFGAAGATNAISATGQTLPGARDFRRPIIRPSLFSARPSTARRPTKLSSFITPTVPRRRSSKILAIGERCSIIPAKRLCPP